jgi:hypothetical protein
MNNFEKPNRIDDLEKKLYSANQSFVQKERKHLNSKEYAVAQDWEAPTLDVQDTDLIEKEKNPNWFFRFFLVALVFFIGTGIYLAINWFLNSGSFSAFSIKNFEIASSPEWPKAGLPRSWARQADATTLFRC